MHITVKVKNFCSREIGELWKGDLSWAGTLSYLGGLVFVKDRGIPQVFRQLRFPIFSYKCIFGVSNL